MQLDLSVHFICGSILSVEKVSINGFAKRCGLIMNHDFSQLSTHLFVSLRYLKL